MFNLGNTTATRGPHCQTWPSTKQNQTLHRGNRLSNSQTRKMENADTTSFNGMSKCGKEDGKNEHE